MRKHYLANFQKYIFDLWKCSKIINDKYNILFLKSFEKNGPEASLLFSVKTRKEIIKSAQKIDDYILPLVAQTNNEVCLFTIMNIKFL